MSRLIRALITVGATAALISVYLAVPDVRHNVDLAMGRIWSAAATGDIAPLREYILSFGLWAPLISALLMIPPIGRVSVASLRHYTGQWRHIRSTLGGSSVLEQRNGSGGSLLRNLEIVRTTAD